MRSLGERGGGRAAAWAGRRVGGRVPDGCTGQGGDNSFLLDLFGSQIQGDLIGASQWRIYQGVAKEFGSATSDSFP